MPGYFFGCPHCRAKLEARDASRAGRTVTCPKCEQSLIIPPLPLMGVSLSQATGQPSDDASSQVVVSSDPGFKRGMSPAKASRESDAVPAPSPSGFERLPSTESLSIAESITVDSPNDIEGYSFTLPENGTGDDSLPALKPKKKRPKSEEVEAPHLFEEPKYQFAALVAVVVLIVGITGIWSWLSRKDEDEGPPAEVTAPADLDSPPGGLGGPPPVTRDPPGGLPGASEGSQPSRSPGLPGPPPVAPSQPEEPAVSSDPADEPAPVPNALPGAGGGLPGAAPSSQTESPPNASPQASEPSPSPQPAP